MRVGSFSPHNERGRDVKTSEHLSVYTGHYFLERNCFCVCDVVNIFRADGATNQ